MTTPGKKKAIRVGMDIRDLRVAKTGQKTVTEELYMQFLHFNDPELEFVFFDSSIVAYTGTSRLRIAWEHIRYQYWKQVLWPWKAWRKKCDILFCCDYYPPIIHLGFKTVELFHDAFFFEYPQHYNKPFLKLFHTLAMPAARKCARIMVTTQHARQRIHQLAGLPLEKLVTIPLAPKTLHDNLATQEASPDNTFPSPSRRYILHVGVMEKRKNLPMLIKAFSLLVKQGYDDIDLVLVGKGNNKVYSDDAAQVHEAVKAHRLEDRVIFTGYLPDEEVARFYKHALFYIFPSFNEGFGIPVLEAFRFNLPVAVADNSSLPEVGGDAVLSFDPFRADAICKAMKKMIDDEGLRQDLVARGKKRLADFSWKNTARTLAELFKHVAEESN